MFARLLSSPQIRSLALAVGIVCAVLVGSGLVSRIVVPGASAPMAGWEPSAPRLRQNSNIDDSTILSRMRILGDTARKRLLAVMVENHETARLYQEGLKQAMLIWEFPVEGFISRFAVVFDADDLPERIGPVRSLRPYFVDALQPWVSTVVHAGASPEAYERAARGDITALNLLSHYGNAERDAAIPEPHNLFVRSAAIAALPGPSIAGTPWPPYAIGTPVTGSSALTVKLNFHNPDHDVVYRYSRMRDAYIRSSGSVADQGHPRNVLILEMPVTGIGEMGRLTIPVFGKGRALLFHGGVVQEGTWRKKDLFGSFNFETDAGDAFVFAPGQTWVTSLPSLDRVRWNEGGEEADELVAG